MASSAVAAPLAIRPSAFQTENDILRAPLGFTSRRFCSAFQTRAGGATGATACASGARRASHFATSRASSASSRIQRFRRARARPRSVPSAYSAARRSRSSGLPLQFKAAPQLRQTAAHPGLDRAERLAQVLRELGVRQAVEERERDRLALPGIQAAQAARHRAGFLRALELVERARAGVRDVLFGAFGQWLRIRPAQPVEAAVAHDAGHPRHRRRPARVVFRRVPPDVDVALLQYLFGPVLTSQYT